jgi:hypothetical protein
VYAILVLKICQELQYQKLEEKIYFRYKWLQDQQIIVLVNLLWRTYRKEPYRNQKELNFLKLKTLQGLSLI